MKSCKSVVLACYGCGGHESQMTRLMNTISPGLYPLDIVSISDSTKIHGWSFDHFVTSEVRSKHRREYFSILKKVAVILRVTRRVSKKYDVACMISTGPGIAVVVGVYLKIFSRVKVIHIESWSRFYSRSLTGCVMNMVADEFYVQNKELLSRYSRAKYSGRL